MYLLLKYGYFQFREGKHDRWEKLAAIAHVGFPLAKDLKFDNFRFAHGNLANIAPCGCFFEGKAKSYSAIGLPSNFFGEYISYLVGNTKFKVLYQDTFGWVRNIYIYIPILHLLKQLSIQWSFSGSGKGWKSVSITPPARRYLLSCGRFLKVFKMILKCIPTSISTESILPTSKKRMQLGPFGPWQLKDHFHRLPVESCWWFFHHRMCVRVCQSQSV